MSFLASFYSTCCSKHFSRRALAAFTLTTDTRLNCESRGKPSGSTPAAKRMKTTGPMDRPDQLAATNESQSNETPSNESNSNDTLRLLNGPPTITLTPTEAQICTLLQDVVSSIYQAQPSNPPLVLRIAGGWVRDKLLGLPSHDIDIAVDHMSGYDLAQHVAQHLETSGQAPRSVAKIASNPERSKHLETATTVILGQAVDFVNLRSETYNADSRIPHITYGTPLEDAMRRDITINAL
ncbi:CCA tRNA nucleotidyltransferase, mitochondrial, partial [Coemansia sp. RSA 2603]